MGKKRKELTEMEESREMMVGGSRKGCIEGRRKVLGRGKREGWTRGCWRRGGKREVAGEMDKREKR